MYSRTSARMNPLPPNYSEAACPCRVERWLMKSEQQRAAHGTQHTARSTQHNSTEHRAQVA